jgi:hypothetical protein
MHHLASVSVLLLFRVLYVQHLPSLVPPFLTGTESPISGEWISRCDLASRPLFFVPARLEFRREVLAATRRNSALRATNTQARQRGGFIARLELETKAVARHSPAGYCIVSLVVERERITLVQIRSKVKMEDTADEIHHGQNATPKQKQPLFSPLEHEFGSRTLLRQFISMAGWAPLQLVF